MKNLKYVIISILIICIILLSTVIVLLKNNSKNDLYLNDDIIEENSNVLQQYETSNGINKVTNRNKYFAVKKILDNYLQYVNYLNSNIDNLEVVITEDMNKEELLNEYKEYGTKILKNMINIDYMNQYSISEDIIFQNLSNISNKNIKINSMYELEKSERINIYFIFGSIENSIESFETIVVTDSLNNTFTILTEEFFEKVNITEQEINSVKIDFETSEIEQNEYNNYSYINISDETMAINYFKDYKEKLQNVELTYNMLDTEYKEKRFGSIENYKNYLQRNYNLIINSELEKYQVVKNNNLNQYVCIDGNGRYYIFTENAIMDYSIILDTYTIDMPEFFTKYNSATDQQKVALNIQKVFDAINNDDYKYVYSKLAESFINNYFNTEEQFENYMKNNRVFENNTVEYLSLKEEAGYYLYNLKLTDANNQSSETKELTVIMQLNDGTDFKIAFNVQ